MIAAAQHFIYRGGYRDEIPDDATHIRVHESTTLIPSFAFNGHPNIVELICHPHVKRIERYAFANCYLLKKAILTGVEHVGEYAFCSCISLLDVTCDQLERIGEGAFTDCPSLFDISLPNIRIVDEGAFINCANIMDVQFGYKLETIRAAAFDSCSALERITIPLQDDMFTHNSIFRGCVNFRRVTLIEESLLHLVIDSFLMDEWKNEMKEEIDSIQQLLPNAPAGELVNFFGVGEAPRKALVLREWIACIFRKMKDFISQHEAMLKEAAAVMNSVLPRDIVTNSVIPFVELPIYDEGETLLRQVYASD